MVQELFATLYRNGYVNAQRQLGAISPSTGRTLPDRYIEGTCPHCGFDGARGDQCDNCGRQLDPIDLINPRSRINGETPQFIETEHFFLDLPAVAGGMGQWLGTRPDWRPNVLKFSENARRAASAGDHPRPRLGRADSAPEWQDAPMKRIYVWFDAVIGYLSASIEWAERSGDPDAWRRWWSGDDAKSYYFMGKDNITFHSVIWPGILLGANGQGERGGSPSAFGVLDLPTEIVSSEFLTMSGSKLASSRGHVIYVRDFLRDFGPDALRYFIAVNGPENQDTDFTWEEFVRRTNFELANEWGNLVNRSISMAHKNVGAIPVAGELNEADEALLQAARDAYAVVGDAWGRCKFKLATSEAMRVVGLANKYISEQEPWKLKDDPARRDTVLHVALQVVQDCNTLLTPLLPHAAQQVFEALGGEGVWAAQPQLVEVTEPGADAPYPVLRGDYVNQQAAWASRPIAVGTALAKPTPIFGKLDPKLAETGPEWAPIET